MHDEQQDGAGVAFLVSAPSGAGKSTVIKRVMQADDRLAFSVSCTTREPRPGGVNETIGP